MFYNQQCYEKLEIQRAMSVLVTCTVGVKFYFDHVYPHYASSPFWKGNTYFLPLYIRSMCFGFYLTMDYSYEIDLNLRRGFYLQCYVCGEIWGFVKLALMHFALLYGYKPMEAMVF